MDEPDHADPSDDLELQVSDVRSGVSPIAAPSVGSPFAPQRTLPRHLGVVVVLVALTVVIAGSPELRAPDLLLLLGPQATPTATGLPTISVHGPVLSYPTPVPGPHVRWQPTAPLPDNLTFGSGDFNFAVAPSDGRTAYLCDVSPPPAGTPTPSGETSRFWVTHDRGAQWTPALEISEQPNATWCAVEIDAFDPSLVVLISSYVDPSAAPPGPVGPLPNQTVSEVTFDGGLTWQRLAGNQVIFQPTTVNGVTFALRATQLGQNLSVPVTTELVMSGDHWHTWTPIDTTIRAASPHLQVRDYTLDPTTGALLVSMWDMTGGPFQLWSSTDTGQHWRTQPLPVGDGTGFNQLVIHPPSRDAARHVCDAAQGNMGTSVVCSADGGTTWTQPIEYPLTQWYHFGGFASDGALLLVAGLGADAQGNVFGAVLYRLPSGATTWQTLGPLPGPIVVCTSGPGTGILWALPLGQSPVGAQGQIFTASYP
jgi:hypothetical protein